MHIAAQKHPPTPENGARFIAVNPHARKVRNGRSCQPAAMMAAAILTEQELICSVLPSEDNVAEKEQQDANRSSRPAIRVGGWGARLLQRAVARSRSASRVHANHAGLVGEEAADPGLILDDGVSMYRVDLITRANCIRKFVTALLRCACGSQDGVEQVG